MSEQKFYLCRHCGKIISMLKTAAPPTICCGEPMSEIIPNTKEASQEKHVPVISVEGDVVTVKVGSAPHPMLPEHFIEWVYLQTENGGQRKKLSPGSEPVAVFSLNSDKALAAYAYCNLHGLWKSEI